MEIHPRQLGFVAWTSPYRELLVEFHHKEVVLEKAVVVHQ